MTRKQGYSLSHIAGKKEHRLEITVELDNYDSSEVVDYICIQIADIDTVEQWNSDMSQTRQQHLGHGENIQS